MPVDRRSLVPALHQVELSADGGLRHDVDSMVVMVVVVVRPGVRHPSVCPEVRERGAKAREKQQIGAAHFQSGVTRLLDDCVVRSV